MSVTETVLVLGVSLGASAIYAILSLVRKLTETVALNQQTTSMNVSVVPDRPWLDLAYQLAAIVLGVAPAYLALHLLRHVPAPPPSTPSAATAGLSVGPSVGPSVGFDVRRPLPDLARGAGLAAAIGIPGLAFYLAARALGLNTSIAAANLTDVWWAVPVLILAAAQNAILEEVVMVGYLFRRWSQAGWAVPTILLVSALIRGGYHLYQGFGGFAGNVVMGLVFGLAYLRWRRVMPLVVAHALIDIVAFVGYALLAGHVSWL